MFGSCCCQKEEDPADAEVCQVREETFSKSSAAEIPVEPMKTTEDAPSSIEERKGKEDPPPKKLESPAPEVQPQQTTPASAVQKTLQETGVQEPAAKQEPALQEPSPKDNNPADDTEFSVVLTCSEDQKIGLSMDYRDMDSFFITGVKANGAIAAWNASNSRYQVCQGMRIITINGIQGNPQAMLPEFSKAGKASLLVRRCQCESNEFAVGLSIATEENLGLSLDWSDKVTFLISAVKPDGAVQSWNKANSQLQIAQGMRIIQINGLRGDAEKMLQELKLKGNVHLIIRKA